MKKMLCIAIMCLLAATPMITKMFAQDAAAMTTMSTEKSGFMTSVKNGLAYVGNAIKDAIKWVINGIQHVFHATISFFKGLFGGNKAAAPMPVNEVLPGEPVMDFDDGAMQ